MDKLCMSYPLALLGYAPLLHPQHFIKVQIRIDLESSMFGWFWMAILFGRPPIDYIMIIIRIMLLEMHNIILLL